MEQFPPGEKLEAPTMFPGDAPELYQPNVDFPPGRLQVSKKIVTTKIQTFWPFDLSFPKKLAMRGFFPCTVVCFSALFGLPGASTAKSPKLLFGLELLTHLG